MMKIDDSLKVWTDNGVCLLCGKKVGKMSKDHIPPQCCGNTGRVIMESYAANANITPVDCKKGLVFRTICKECNTLLGEKYDHVLGAFVKDIRRILESQLIYPYPRLEIKTQPTRLLKAILGHLVATMNHINSCDNNSYLQDIRDYVLSTRVDVPKNLHVFYWLFPYKYLMISRNHIALLNYFERNVCCILKFYPVAFAVVFGKMEKFFTDEDLVLAANNCSEDRYKSIRLTLPGKALPYDFPESTKYGVILSPQKDVGYIAIKK